MDGSLGRVVSQTGLILYWGVWKRNGEKLVCANDRFMVPHAASLLSSGTEATFLAERILEKHS